MSGNANMTVLSLSHNPLLQGYLDPAWYTSMPRLATLDVSHTQTTGVLPDIWGTTGTFKPRFLNISYTNVTGPLPPSWGSMVYNMVVFAAAGTGLAGPVPFNWTTADVGAPLPSTLAVFDVS